MSQIAKSYLLVTACTVIGLALGFASNLVMAAKFGVGLDMDVYQAVVALPTVIVSLASGSLQYTFIPVFAEYRAKNDDAALWNFVSSFLNLSIVVTILVSMVGMIYAERLVAILTPGFSGEKLEKSADLLRLLFPTITLSIVSELLSKEKIKVYYI